MPEGTQNGSRFSTTPYQPDGGTTPSGIGMLLAGTIVSSALLGFVVGWVQQFFYLIILFPILIGLAIGAASSWFAKRGKVRSPLMGGLAGLIGGIVVALSTHYYGYRTFESAFMAELKGTEGEAVFAEFIAAKRSGAELTPEMKLAEQMLLADNDGKLLIKTLEAKSLFGYIDVEAQAGVTVSRGGSGFNLGYIGTYIYWLVELGIISALAFFMVGEAVQVPFCTRCNEWKQEVALGGVEPPAMDASQFVASGDLEKLKELGLNSDTTGTFPITLSSCSRCGEQSTTHLKLQQVTINDKGERANTVLSHTTYPGEAIPAIRKLFTT
jgi:hypothetical protein